MLATLLMFVAFQGAADIPPRELAPGVHLIAGVQTPDRGPDGNTIVFEGREGLVVVDTGRHVWHSDAILNFAQARGRPIAAIVNTHWHLDHSSGNGRIKAAFPRARVYATNAIDRALAEGGFLARDFARTPEYLADPGLTETDKDEVRIFIATMGERDVLRPDTTLARSERRRIGGRGFDVHVTEGAVTDADIWLYDRSTRIVVLGDLVTFPVPYFETACPNRWRAALDEVWATPFELAAPGHGDPMTRDQFNVYRTAFGGLVDCAHTEAAVESCGERYSHTLMPLLNGDETRRQRVAAGVAYYVGFLRENGGKSADCLAN